ncbi:YceI family protein [Sulfurovum mangrovi]|uniref:YceI family protein n=1 Tax=Sulfurovum mangrovi TaxID=2893889 RepID=UPI001E4FC41C|nr:YceI family protein [Sulfurovum mangrovi]UFH60268.1 YceI family protein [Sulfurovum mangrovi]
MKLIKLGLISILAGGTLFAGTYNVDPDHSHIGFKVKHMMISNVNGKFDTFSGTFEYDEKTKTFKSLNGTVEVKSINTENAKRDEHLRTSDFFAAAEYPKMTFVLEKVEGDTAYGKLTMRGVSKDVALEFENNGMVKDPWGNTRVGVALSGKINRIDYGIKYNEILEAGGVAVGETVKITIELEGILAK